MTPATPDSSGGRSPRPAPGLEVAPGVYAPADAIRMQFARGSGPGGQNVNKVNTKAEIWVEVGRLAGLSAGAIARLRTAAGSRLTIAGEIHLASDESRSQEGNRAEVFRRLREMILAARHEPKRRKKTKPSYGSKMRRLESKKRKSDIKAGRRRVD